MNAEATAAAVTAALDRRRFSYEVRRRCDDDDDDDDATTALTDNKPLWRTSVSSPAVVHHSRPRRDNSVVLVEVICHGDKQQARTPARPRPRSASESPSKRSRAASPATGQVTGPASDSEITARRTHSRRMSCDNAAGILQVCIVFYV